MVVLGWIVMMQDVESYSEKNRPIMKTSDALLVAKYEGIGGW
jgi:hypothetical protein